MDLILPIIVAAATLLGSVTALILKAIRSDRAAPASDPGRDDTDRPEPRNEILALRRRPVEARRTALLPSADGEKMRNDKRLLSRISRLSTLKQAIVWTEILSPPVSEREPR